MPTTWTKDTIRAAILDTTERGNKMIERSLIKLYQNQTTDEQLSLMTKHENGIGFNGTDAVILSSFAQWVEKGAAKNIPEGKRLSHKQREIARKKLPKYAGQLLKAVEAKATTPVQS